MSAIETQAKRYSLVGGVSSLVVRKDRNGKDWVAFDLLRQDGAKIKCVAFTDKAARFLSQFRNGSTAKVFGYFESRRFVGQDGKTRTTPQFKLLWSGSPTEGGLEAA